MLISYSHRFIFVHVGKSAGLSIRNALRPYCTEPEKFKIRKPPKLKNNQPNPMYTVWESLLLHPSCLDIRREVPPEIFAQFYKFAFVRNTWDILVSLYHFMLRDPAIPRHAEVKALAGFDEFIEWAIAEKNPFPKGITKFQSDMLTDEKGQLLVDFVGHYESLEQDFAGICRRLGIDASLPHLNRSRHTDYRCYYTDRARGRVQDYFQRDIQLFGHSFDGGKRQTT